MPAHKRFSIWMVALLASGCGGGGGDGLGDAFTDLTGPSGPSLVSWTDSANGSTVKDADNDALAFDTDGVMVRQDVRYPGVKVRSADAAITWSGTVIGTVTLVDSTSPGSQVATTLCVGGAPLNFTFLSDHVEYNCVTPQASSGGSATSAGSTTRQGSGRSLVKWTGNSLETLIKDAEDDYHVVDSSSRQLLFVGSQADGPQLIDTPTVYTNSQVDSAANVIIDNVVVGYLTLGSSQAGTPLALLKCSDGRPMSVSHTSAAPALARWGCVGSASAGGGGGGGGSTSGGSASGGGSTYAFTPFNNSANGICIIDNSGDCFAVDSRTQRLSFIGPVGAVAIDDTGATPSRTYANARGLYNGTVLVGLAVDGQRLADVYAVNLQSSGKRGPAFICDQKYYAEIYENPDRPGDALLRCTDQLASL